MSISHMLSMEPCLKWTRSVPEVGRSCLKFAIVRGAWRFLFSRTRALTLSPFMSDCITTSEPVPPDAPKTAIELTMGGARAWTRALGETIRADEAVVRMPIICGTRGLSVCYVVCSRFVLLYYSVLMPRRAGNARARGGVCEGRAVRNGEAS